MERAEFLLMCPNDSGKLISLKEILSYFKIYFYAKLHNAYILVPQKDDKNLQGTYYIITENGCKLDRCKRNEDELYPEIRNMLASKNKELIEMDESIVPQDIKEKMCEELLRLNPNGIYYSINIEK